MKEKVGVGVIESVGVGLGVLEAVALGLGVIEAVRVKEGVEGILKVGEAVDVEEGVEDKVRVGVFVNVEATVTVGVNGSFGVVGWFEPGQPTTKKPKTAKTITDRIYGIFKICSASVK